MPLLAGSRVVLVPVDDDDVLLRPPASPAHVVDVGAAVRDALRFPLSGPPLEAVVTRGGRVTIVVEPPSLPLPGAQIDPRPEALAAVLSALDEAGVRNERQTILLAGGLTRRAGQSELERLLPPPEARGFRGRVLVHDAEDERLVALTGAARVHPALVETDLVLVVGAAETLLHGGPAALLGACDAATVRQAADAESLLDAGRAPAWRSALAVESGVSARAPVLGVSLVLDLPRLTGAFRGYPEDPEAVRRVVRSWRRTLFSSAPGPLRRVILDAQARSVSATAAFAGTPSVAHAEALVRGVELRGARLAEPVDALVVGVPWIGSHLPREPTNPVTAAAIALGLVMRFNRDAYPVGADGTLVLAHSLTRSFGRGEAPYATLLSGLRAAGGRHAIESLERAAVEDAQAIADYRAGRSCHPLLPYADWAGCAPALDHLGRVVAAGCRDAAAARALGIVPSHGISSALEMAHGVAGGRARIGVLLAPPYPPLLVG